MGQAQRKHIQETKLIKKGPRSFWGIVFNIAVQANNLHLSKGTEKPECYRSNYNDTTESHSEVKNHLGRQKNMIGVHCI